MDPLWIVIIILASYIVLYDLIRPIVIYSIVSNILLKHHLVRKDKTWWARGKCSEETNYEQMKMWEAGIEWGNKNKDKCHEVSIVSDGLNLFGEFYDFKKDKTVMIIPGRTETLQYSYFYAIAYEKLGFNIFVMDKRAHGNSDGKFEDCGQYSYIDQIRWAEFLHETFGCNDITIHAICVGCATATFALASDKCPPYIKRFVADGMFRTFAETFKNHMKLDKRETFPALPFMVMRAKAQLKIDIYRNGPIYQIQKVKVPTLFIYTLLDKFSTPEQAKALYEKCGAEKKKLVFFEHGGHSHILYNEPDKYIQTIDEFIKETA